MPRVTIYGQGLLRPLTQLGDNALSHGEKGTGVWSPEKGSSEPKWAFSHEAQASNPEQPTPTALPCAHFDVSTLAAVLLQGQVCRLPKDVMEHRGRKRPPTVSQTTPEATGTCTWFRDVP